MQLKQQKPGDKKNAMHATTTEPEDEYYCGICQALDGDSVEVEYWVGFEKCDTGSMEAI